PQIILLHTCKLELAARLNYTRRRESLRRVRPRGLQPPVGRVPSRGGTSVIFNARAVMNDNHGLALVAPRITPVLDQQFRPAVLANRRFQEQVRAASNPAPVRLALEQTEDSISHFNTQVLPAN